MQEDTTDTGTPSRLIKAAVDAHQQALAAAVDKGQQLEALLVAARAALEADKDANRGMRGAPTLARRNKTARLHSEIRRLEQGYLPGEYPEVQAVPAGSLVASARAKVFRTSLED